MKRVHRIQNLIWGTILVAAIVMFLIVGGMENFRIGILPGVIGCVSCSAVMFGAMALGCWLDQRL